MIATSPAATDEASVCAWCGAPLPRPRTQALWLLRCEGCGVFTVPDWRHAQRPALPAGRGEARPQRRLCTLGEAARRSARRHLARRVARIAPPGPVLAVAGPDSLLIDALRSAGRLATGIAERVGGGTVDRRLIDADITELGGRYAAVVFWQSLGRLRAPGAALEHAAALLKPGGLLTVAQPGPLRQHARVLGGMLLPNAAPTRERTLIPPQALVERLLALGLKIDVVDPTRERRPPGGRLHGLLGGVTAVEARR